MAIPEEKIVKIVDTDFHTRGASVDQVGDKGALVTKVMEVGPLDDSSLNAEYAFTNVNDEMASQMVISKTIGEQTYTRTVSYNSYGDVLSISAWQ